MEYHKFKFYKMCIVYYRIGDSVRTNRETSPMDNEMLDLKHLSKECPWPSMYLKFDQTNPNKIQKSIMINSKNLTSICVIIAISLHTKLSPGSFPTDSKQLL